MKNLLSLLLLTLALSSFAQQGNYEDVKDQYRLKTLDEKVLVLHHFNATYNKNALRYQYQDGKRDREVILDTIMHYPSNNKEYALVMFKDYEIDEDGKRASCHVCSGRLFIVRYIKNGNEWEEEENNDSCDCGVASWGEVSIPELVKVGENYFLVGKRDYLGQGYYSESLQICNTDNFQSALALTIAESNEGVATHKKDIHSYKSTYEFTEKGGEIHLKVQRDGTNLDEARGVIVAVHVLDEYVYDRTTLKFSLVK